MFLQHKQLATMAAGLAALFLGSLPADGGGGTAFTYQGQLKRGGVPINESADFEFKLLDGLGDPVGSIVPVSSVGVVGGLFTVELDFGPGAFDGADRVLEIRVRLPAGTGSFVTLAPPQPVTPSPYALYALAGNEGPPGPQGEQGDPGEEGPPGDSHWEIDGTSTFYMDGNVGIGSTSPTEKLTVDGTIESTVGGFKFPDGSIQSTATVGTGDGHSLDAADGSPVDALFVDELGQVGIGTTFPLATHHVRNLTVLLPLPALESDDLIIESPDAVLGLYSDDAGGFGSAIALKEIEPPPGGLVDTWGIVRLTNGSGSALRFTYGDSHEYWSNPTQVQFGSDGKVGIGTTDPQTPLHVGTGIDVTGDSENVGGGDVAIGASGQSNLLFDGNEIQSHMEGIAKPLFLNDRGGDVILAKEGNVGIGTAVPDGRLHVVGDPGDSSVILPDDSVGSDEMLDEPGVASHREDAALVFLPEITETFASRTIECPADGFVLAIGTVNVINLSTSDLLVCLEIMESDGTIESCSNTGEYLADVSMSLITIQGLFAVSAGPNTFYFKGRYNGDVSLDVSAQDRKLTLMYFPTAYGTVDTD